MARRYLEEARSGLAEDGFDAQWRLGREARHEDVAVLAEAIRRGTRT